MHLWDFFGWTLVALSLLGNVFVIRRNILGFWIWTVSNIGWVVFNLWEGIISQATLFFVYLLLAIWGIWSWSKEPEKAS